MADKQTAPQAVVATAANGLSQDKIERLKAMFGGDPEFTNLKLIESLMIPTIDGQTPVGALSDMRLVINPRGTDAEVAGQARMVTALMLAVQGSLGIIKTIVSEPVETEEQRAARVAADSTV
jgi:hypothetical protein